MYNLEMPAKRGIKYKTISLGQTKKLAAFLAEEILKQKKPKTKNAVILALTGDLGSGKTAFVQGFLRAAGIKKRIISPTFILMRKIKIPIRRSADKIRISKTAYHIDCYRIQEPEELAALGLKKIFKNQANIVFIEWAERIKKLLPENAIWLKFKHGPKENVRLIEIA